MLNVVGLEPASFRQVLIFNIFQSDAGGEAGPVDEAAAAEAGTGGGEMKVQFSAIATDAEDHRAQATRAFWGAIEADVTSKVAANANQILMQGGNAGCSALPLRGFESRRCS